MTGDLVVRWIVTVLLGVSIAGYLYVLGADRSRWPSAVNHVLHLVMAVAMVVMAWPIGEHLPVVAPMAFFLLAAAWFVVAGSRGCGGGPDRVTNGYYAAMMVAMAWMYAVMHGGPLDQTGHPAHHPHAEMSGTAMSATAGTASASGWIAVVNTIASVGFAAATVWWVYRCFAARSTATCSAPVARVELLSQALMAASIALMLAPRF
ncbi:DUF5134 domain-containing protein [Mycobacterium talmoniae]|uniref:DUF5134 domain-containing protein n=1 Tax=Mycobacterium talmoniae TaxID=1858794 RepID=A0A1S1NGC1_9MYCO|nr:MULTISPECIES: DUF5134 domain-containing protein [Mycobacterium]OHV01319.1 hypothetical protein BKN37_17155 [Mycobacterium talmoniae]